jgi:transcriptional regulator with XRE-family HTH domain
MSTRERPIDRGARLGRQLRQSIGEELRRGRVAADLTQQAVGDALGWSHNKVGRIERGVTPKVSVDDLARAFAIVGMEFSARAYPVASPMRDRAHLEVLERFHARISATFDWRTEVPLPNAGDLRTWDAIARAEDIRIAIECETRPTDWQALERRLHLKERDGRVDRLILVLSDTRSNRAFVREHARAIAASFPVSGRAALAALAAGHDPGGNAVVLV